MDPVKLADLIVHLYADADGLSDRDTAFLADSGSLSAGAAAALQQALWPYADGELTPAEQASLVANGLAPAVVHLLAGSDGKWAVGKRLEWYREQLIRGCRGANSDGGDDWVDLSTLAREVGRFGDLAGPLIGALYAMRGECMDSSA